MRARHQLTISKRQPPSCLACGSHETTFRVGFRDWENPAETHETFDGRHFTPDNDSARSCPRCVAAVVAIVLKRNGLLPEEGEERSADEIEADAKSC